MAWIVNAELVKTLSADPTNTFLNAFRKLDNNLSNNASEWESAEFEQILEVIALLEVIIESGRFEGKAPPPPIDDVHNTAATDLYNYLYHAAEALKTDQSIRQFHNLKASFAAKLGGGFYYEFSEGDLSRVQALINELREKISESSDFDPDHRQRLLKRLEAIQREMHKKVADMDRFWGLVGDAGVVLGKFGENAKPIVDRIREIADIVWRTQARAEELPSGSSLPLLGSGAKKGEDSA